MPSTSAMMDITGMTCHAEAKPGERCVETHLHGIYPFLVWHFFYLMTQLTYVQHFLRNLEGLADVMLQQQQYRL